MFIELTDHLRCPSDHEESILVLLPDVIEGRSVRRGQLGCPVCGRTFAVTDGVFDAGDVAAVDDPGPSALNAEGLTVLTGLHGPGGYMVLVGSLVSLWEEIQELIPGVALVGINPGPDVRDVPGISVLRGGRIPLKSRSVRGVALGKPYADDPYWVSEAARVVLPGLRVLGEGTDPPADLIEVMASADGVWVGTVKR